MFLFVHQELHYPQSSTQQVEDWGLCRVLGPCRGQLAQPCSVVQLCHRNTRPWLTYRTCQSGRCFALVSVWVSITNGWQKDKKKVQIYVAGDVTLSLLRKAAPPRQKSASRSPEAELGWLARGSAPVSRSGSLAGRCSSSPAAGRQRSLAHPASGGSARAGSTHFGDMLSPSTLVIISVAGR